MDSSLEINGLSGQEKAACFFAGICGITALVIGIIGLIDIELGNQVGMASIGLPSASILTGSGFLLLIGSVVYYKIFNTHPISPQINPQLESDLEYEEIDVSKPLVVPSLDYTQKVPEELCLKILQLKKGDLVWIGENKEEIQLLQKEGSGGSKKAWKISEEEVLMLPNEFSGYYLWRRQVDEEVQISDRLSELGILTVGSKRVDIYLSQDSDVPLVAYTCPSFKALARKGMYVIDGKNNTTSSCWKTRYDCGPEEDPHVEMRSFFKGSDPHVFANWKPIVLPLLRDIYTLAKNNCILGHDSLNLVIIEDDKGFIARYFGFDFTSKASTCNRRYGPATKDVFSDCHFKDFLGKALHKVFWEQNDFNENRETMCLSREYDEFIERFVAESQTILTEMGI